MNLALLCATAIVRPARAFRILLGLEDGQQAAVGRGSVVGLAL